MSIHLSPSPWRSRLRRCFLFLLIGTAGFLLVVQHATPTAANRLQQGPDTPPDSRNGMMLFQQNCAPCHGALGLGDGDASNGLPENVNGAVLADPALVSAATPAGWFEVVKEGRMDRFMPPWKNQMTDQQIWDTVSFALSLHVLPEQLAEGQTIWGEQCAACHGDTGQGDGPQALKDSLVMPDLSDPVATAARSLADWQTIIAEGKDTMPAFADELSPAQITAAAEQARTFAFPPVMLEPVPEGSGVISGQVLNATSKQPVSATVTLNAFDNFNALQSKTISTAADGSFRFEKIATGTQYAYIVTTVYNDFSFGSQPVTFAEGSSSAEALINVYETSAVAGDIRISTAQWFIDQHQGALLVGELYRITYTSDTVYTGSEEVAPGSNIVLRFPLPAEAASLVLDGGELGQRFVRTADGVVDTQPLMPGTSQILMRYLMPYSGEKITFAHAVAYPTDNLSVLVVDGPAVDTELTNQGPTTVAEQQWTNFVGLNLPANQTIRLALSDLDQAQPAATTAGAARASEAVIAYNPGLLYGIVAVAALALLALFVALALRRPVAVADKPAPSALAAGAVAGPAARRAELLASLAHLDDLHAAGELDEAAYQRARIAQKRALLVQELSATPAADAASEGTL
ncbi:MAG: c-type cytochrome [Caldilineales bacterium]